MNLIWQRCPFYICQ